MPEDVLASTATWEVSKADNLILLELDIEWWNVSATGVCHTIHKDSRVERSLKCGTLFIMVIAEEKFRQRSKCREVEGAEKFLPASPNLLASLPDGNVVLTWVTTHCS